MGYFLFVTASRPALGFTQLPMQWALEALTPGIKRQEREANRSPHLVPGLIMCGAILPLPIRLHVVTLG
jgi:hypothetical protein